MSGIKCNKTSVGSVKLGKTLDLGKRLSLGYLENLDRVKGVSQTSWIVLSLLVSIPYQNLRPHGPFLHVEKFVVGGGWVVVGVKCEF